MAEEACTNATQKATARSKTCKVRNDACSGLINGFSLGISFFATSFVLGSWGQLCFLPSRS